MTYGAQKSDRANEAKEFADSKMGVKGLSESGSNTIPRIFIYPPEKLIGLKPRPSSSDGIPIIDFSGINSDGRPEIVKRIRDAARTVGIFKVINHGIPASVLDSALAGIKDFNEQSREIRSQHHSREMSGGVKFVSNLDLYLPGAASWRDTIYIVMGPVQPDFGRIPEICRKGVLDWDEQVKALGKKVMESLSEGLGLRRERLKEVFGVDGRSMACHYYPYCPQPELTMGIQSHTDVGAFTVLLQDQIGGLQVNHGGEWVEVKPLPGSIIVNIGDSLQITSNNEYKSGEHRVVANAHREPRISIAVFFKPSKRDESHYYGPLPELLSPEKPALYRKFNTQEFENTLSSKELYGMSLADKFKL